MKCKLEQCPKELVQREGEYDCHFKVRVFCDRHCADIYAGIMYRQKNEKRIADKEHINNAYKLFLGVGL